MTVASERRSANAVLRRVREELRMSQNDFAMAVKKAGAELGQPNTCNKRLVQKWEAGEHSFCRGNYQRALERVTGLPFAELGFAGSVGGIERADVLAGASGVPAVPYYSGPLVGGVSALRRVRNLRHTLVLFERDLSELQDALERSARLGRSPAPSGTGPQSGIRVAGVPVALSAETLAGVLLRERMRVGLSRRQMSERLGVNLPTVTSWELGRSVSSLPHMAAYARAVGLRLELRGSDAAGLGGAPGELGRDDEDSDVRLLVAGLRARREQMGLSVGALSAHMRVGESVVRMCEEGRRYPRVPEALAWAAAVRCAVVLVPRA